VHRCCALDRRAVPSTINQCRAETGAGESTELEFAAPSAAVRVCPGSCAAVSDPATRDRNERPPHSAQRIEAEDSAPSMPTARRQSGGTVRCRRRRREDASLVAARGHLLYTLPIVQTVIGVLIDPRAQ